MRTFDADEQAFMAMSAEDWVVDGSPGDMGGCSLVARGLATQERKLEVHGRRVVSVDVVLPTPMCRMLWRALKGSP